MEQDWRVLATQRAEYMSGRIRGLLSSGLDFLRAELGLDLGIKPEQYPSWLILSAALIGLTALLLIAACGRRKRRVAPVPVSPSTAVVEAPIKAAVPPKAVKTEPSEPKKRNKKKAAEKVSVLMAVIQNYERCLPRQPFCDNVNVTLKWNLDR